MRRSAYDPGAVMIRSSVAGAVLAGAVLVSLPWAAARAADQPADAAPAGAPAGAAGGAPENATPREKMQAELRAAGAAASQALRRGPAQIGLGDQGTLQLPEGYGFIPAAEGGRVMRAMGNSVDAGFQGMVVPLNSEGRSSFFLLSFEPSGYVKDDDAKDWKPDELLQQVREGTEEGNKRRAQMGIPAVEVTGWIEPPRYQAEKHQLVWSIGSRERGAPAGEAEGVNYRTLVLGREGYLTMTLVTDKEHVAALMPATATLLDNLTFGAGKRYADFNASTDHVAEIGLAALVAGVAAKKLGLLALIVAFAVKFAKVILIAVAGFGLALRKKLGLAKKAAPAASGMAAAATQVAAAQAAIAPTAAAGPPPEAAADKAPPQAPMP